MPAARLDLRIDPDLKDRVAGEAARRGQTLTLFAERAFEAALAGVEGPAAVPPVGEPAKAARLPVRGSASPSLARWAQS